MKMNAVLARQKVSTNNGAPQFDDTRIMNPVHSSYKRDFSSDAVFFDIRDTRGILLTSIPSAIFGLLLAKVSYKYSTELKSAPTTKTAGKTKVCCQSDRPRRCFKKIMYLCKPPSS